MSESQKRKLTPCPSCGTPRRSAASSPTTGYCCRRTLTNDPDSMAWMLEEAARLRASEPAANYVALRLRRHPWISLPEAAIELDVSQGRISQLISAGTLKVRKHPDGGGKKQVLTADVLKYQTNPQKKTRTKTA